MRIQIAVPFYGNVEHLKECVQSVIEQTFPEWSLIVVDDGYPDISISRWFANLGDSRITYIRNSRNLGANGNYVKCLSLLDSEYAVIMGADDIMAPNFLEEMVELANRFPSADMLHACVKVVDSDSNEVNPIGDRLKNLIRPRNRSAVLLTGEKVATSLMIGNWLYFPSLMWKTSRLKQVGFRPNLNVCQDLALVIDLLKSDSSMAISNEVVFKYRRHIASDSSSKAFDGTRFDEERRFFNQLSSEFRQKRWYTASVAARLRLTSRLHSLFLIPRALRHKGNYQKLLRNTFL